MSTKDSDTLQLRVPQASRMPGIAGEVLVLAAASCASLLTVARLCLPNILAWISHPSASRSIAGLTFGTALPVTLTYCARNCADDIVVSAATLALSLSCASVIAHAAAMMR